MGKMIHGHNVIDEKPENMSLLGKLGIEENINTKIKVK
jgi:hypothetical protein